MTGTKEPQRSCHRILVVDDSPDLTHIIQMSLEIKGYQVKTARDGDDGYRTYLSFDPDLVITDIQMPNRDGLELIKNIRARKPGIRVIYMSGALSRFEPCLEQEKKRHKVSLLEKPFSRVQLFTLVSENIQRSPVCFLGDKTAGVESDSQQSSGA